MIKIATAAAFLSLSLPALACDYPESAEIPNGSTATREEMLAGQQAVKDYIAAMEEYLACIEEEEQSTLETLPDISDEERVNRERALTMKHNAAVEEMELIAARFNEEVRIYRAQSE